MAGTKLGGVLAAETNYERYGKGYYYDGYHQGIADVRKVIKETSND